MGRYHRIQPPLPEYEHPSVLPKVASPQAALPWWASRVFVCGLWGGRTHSLGPMEQSRLLGREVRKQVLQREDQIPAK